MMGFSASGQFSNHFAILHPERILATAAGSPGGCWPLAPIDRWQGEALNYNVGIADVEALTGIAIDPAKLRAVPLFLCSSTDGPRYQRPDSTVKKSCVVMSRSWLESFLSM